MREPQINVINVLHISDPELIQFRILWLPRCSKSFPAQSTFPFTFKQAFFLLYGGARVPQHDKLEVNVFEE